MGPERGDHALVPKNAESPPFPAPCRDVRLMLPSRHDAGRHHSVEASALPPSALEFDPHAEAPRAFARGSASPREC
jgi:hypothetical protein